MEKLKLVLSNYESNLKDVNRMIFKYRVKQRKVGLTEKERIKYREFRLLQYRYIKQIKGLKKKLGLDK